MSDKYIVLVIFLYLHNNYEIEGVVALFFDKDDTIPMADQEIIKEIKLQYGYDTVKIIHKQKEMV